MAKSNATTKQSKRQPTTDCHCSETKSTAKSKEKKSTTKPCDCSDCK